MRWIPYLLILPLLFALCGGCTRAYYRQRADADAYFLVDQKTAPDWPLTDYTIEVDPRSRMYDPFDQDRPPMPPDDPTAHQLMHYVDGKKGSRFWHHDGDTPFVASPFWKNYLPLDERGILVINSERAVNIALLNSRGYQGALESLYLSALDVSFERFRFDSQFFAGYSVDYRATGTLSPRTGPSSTLTTSTFPAARGIRMEKLNATGGTLVVGLANRLVWQFAGTNTHDASTLLDFSLVQPLLQFAGKKRVLERLTLTERSLLANVRQMERFRRGFYVDIITGSGGVNGPNRAGGLFGGSGLDGFAGVGGGGFGRLGGGGGQAGGAGAGQAGGFLGLVQTQQQIRNQEEFIAQLSDQMQLQLEFLRETAKTGARVDEEPDAYNERRLREQLQVEQAQQELLQAKSEMLNLQDGYQRGLDDFKSSLGLPPQICLEIEDPLLEQFQFFDTNSQNQQRRLIDIQIALGDAGEKLLEMAQLVRDEEGNVRIDVDGTPLRMLPWSEEVHKQVLQINDQLSSTREVLNRLRSEVAPPVNQAITSLNQAVPLRVSQLEKLAAKHDRVTLPECALLPPPEVDEAVFNAKELEGLPGELRTRLEKIEQKLSLAAVNGHVARLAKLQSRVDALLKLCTGEGPGCEPEVLMRDYIYPLLYGEARDVDAERPIREELTVRGVQHAVRELMNDAQDLLLLRARAKAEAMRLVWIDLDPHLALEIARVHRRDWMNARASLVDSWRLIAFNANALRSNVDVIFEGEIANTGDNPFRLRGDAGSLRAGLQFTAPITRLAERNTYRQSLIEYQQARRNYYSFEDDVARGLRSILRRIEVNQLNFEYNRFAVRVAARQIETNANILELNQGSGATSTRDAVQGFRALLNAQNNFLSVWVNYEVLRQSLDLNLGTMQLDPHGHWIDPGEIDSSSAEHFLHVPEELLDGEEIPAPLPLEEIPEMLPLP